MKKGTVIYGEKVMYGHQMFNKSKVKLDGSPYPATDISFYRDENGDVYGNMNGFMRSIGSGKGVCFF